jgi:hypothetical protein
LSGRQQCKGIFVVYTEEAFPKEYSSNSLYMFGFQKLPALQFTWKKHFLIFCSTIKAFHRARSRNIEVDKNTGSPSEGRPVNLPTARN